MDNKIECKDTAYKVFIDYLTKKYQNVKVVGNANKSRHKIVQVRNGALMTRYYLIYKREWFNTFSKQFDKFVKKYPEYEGVKGESINQSSLSCATSNFCDFLIFCHPEGYYLASTVTIKNFCLTNGLYRVQERENTYKAKGGGYLDTREATFSFPAVPMLLDKVNLDE